MIVTLLFWDLDFKNHNSHRLVAIVVVVLQNCINDLLVHIIQNLQVKHF
jgi:hypothetical protein